MLLCEKGTIMKELSSNYSVRKKSKRTLIEYTFSVLSHRHSKLNSFRLTSWYASLEKLSCRRLLASSPSPTASELVSLETREGKKPLQRAVLGNSIEKI